MTLRSLEMRLGGPDVLGLSIQKDVDLVTLVERGIPKSTIKYLADSLNIHVRELTNYLPVTNRNLHRYRNSDLLNETVSDHIIALAELFEYGEEMLGKDYFRDWLHSKILALGNRRPADFLKTHKGIDIIRDELGRIAYGIFA